MRPMFSLVFVPLFLVASAPAGAEEPAEFLEDAKLLSRIVACSGDAPLPEGLDAAVVAEHCQALAPRKLKQSWAAPNFSEACSNVELGFRKAGDPAAKHEHLLVMRRNR